MTYSPKSMKLIRAQQFWDSLRDRQWLLLYDEVDRPDELCWYLCQLEKPREWTNCHVSWSGAASIVGMDGVEIGGWIDADRNFQGLPIHSEEAERLLVAACHFPGDLRRTRWVSMCDRFVFENYGIAVR